MNKPFYKSKTFWVGAISVVVGILTYCQGQLDTGASITLQGILMVLLRTLTNTGLTTK